MTANRKKAVVLIVNKPDWFEPGELTYLGFDNDYSEIPMIESDCIRGDIDYSDTTKYFADGTQYATDPNLNSDGTPLIAGAKKILKLTGTDFSRNPNSGYYEWGENGTATLTFPQKYLVKLKVGRGSAFNNQNIQITDLGDSGITIDYRGLAYGDGKIYALSHSGDTLGAVSCYDIALGAWYTLAEASSLTWYWHGLAYDDYSGRLATCGAEYNALRIMNMSTNQWETNWEGSISSNYGYKGKFYSLCGNMLRITDAFTGALISTVEFVNSRFIRAYDGHIYAAGASEIHVCDELGGNQKSYNCPTLSGIGDWCVMNEKIWILKSGGGIYACNLDGSNPQLVCNVNSMLGSDSARTFYSMCCDGKRNLYLGNYRQNSIPNHVFCVDLGITSSLQFLNVSGNNTPHSIDSETTYWITPDQISGAQDSDGNYTISFSAANLRLISAEITNRPYTKVTPTITRNGDVFTLNAKVPFVVPIRVTGSNASITYKNVLTNSNVPRSFSHSQAFQVTPEKIQYVKTFDSNSNPVYKVTLTPTNVSIGSPQIGTIEVQKASVSELSLDSKTPNSGSFSNEDATFSYSTTKLSDEAGNADVVHNSDGTGTITCPTGAVLHVKAVPHGSVTFHSENNIDLNKITATSVTTPNTSEYAPTSTNTTNARTFTITGSTKFHFEGGEEPSGGYMNVNSTLGPHFGHNLSLYKVRYSCNNSRILYANLKDQWLRDYSGQYNRGNKGLKQLILRKGTLASQCSGNSTYTVRGTYGIGENTYTDTDTLELWTNFRDPCVTSNILAASTTCAREEYVNSGEYTFCVYGLSGTSMFFVNDAFGSFPFSYYSIPDGTTHSLSGSTLGWNSVTVSNFSEYQGLNLNGGHLLQCYWKNGMEKELILANPTPYVANTPYSANSNGVVQDATIWDYLQKNGDAEGNGGIYLVRLPSNLSTQIVAGDYICFNGDGELDVFVSPYGTIKFDCDNEREMKHELYKEYNFCLEPSQMTDLGNGYQQVTFTTTGDVTVTATYEIKQKTQVTVTKPNNVAFATINVTGHKKEMEWTTSASTIVGYPIGGDGFRFDGTRVHVGNTNGNGEVSYSDDYGVTWNTFNDIELKSGFRPGDLPNAIVFLRDYVDMYISYDNKHYIILPGQFSVASDHSSFNAGFKWSRNKDATVKYMQIFNSGRVAISNDGFNWTNSATLLLPESRCLFRNGVYHVNNKWYTLTAGAANLYLYTSVDGVNWEMITNPKGPSGDWGTGNLLGLAYGSNLMMAMGTGGRLVGTSRDFKTVKWRQSSVNLGLEVGGLRHICYANGNFIIGQGGTAIAYTTFHDGVMWRVNGSTKNQIGAASRDIDHSVSGTINTEENNSTVYSSNMTITDISVTYDKVVPLNPSTVVEYKKIRLPENSAYIDYSDSSRPVYIANADAFQNSLSHKNGWIYDSAKGFFVNRSNTGYYSDIDCIMSGDHTSLSYSDDPFSMYQYTLDGFMFVNDRPQNRYSTSGLSRTYTSFSSFMRTGLSWNDYMGTAGTISLIMQTLTLPINAALWAGADGSTLHSHHWQSNADGNWNGKSATDAVKEVTKSACTKLKNDWGDNLQIYLIRYRKQDKYKHPVTQTEMNFDYSYLDNCATGTDEPYIYDISTQEELTSALSLTSAKILKSGPDMKKPKMYRNAKRK